MNLCRAAKVPGSSRQESAAQGPRSRRPFQLRRSLCRGSVGLETKICHRETVPRGQSVSNERQLQGLAPSGNTRTMTMKKRSSLTEMLSVKMANLGMLVVSELQVNPASQYSTRYPRTSDGQGLAGLRNLMVLSEVVCECDRECIFGIERRNDVRNDALRVKLADGGGQRLHSVLR